MQHNNTKTDELQTSQCATRRRRSELQRCCVHVEGCCKKNNKMMNYRDSARVATVGTTRKKVDERQRCYVCCKDNKKKVMNNTDTMCLAKTRSTER